MERAWAGRAGRTRLESRPHCATSYTSYFSSLSLSFPVSENWIIPCAQRRKLISAWPFGGYSVTLLLRWAGLQDGAQDVCPWLWAGLVNTMGPHSHDHVMLHGKREFADVIKVPKEAESEWIKKELILSGPDLILWALKRGKIQQQILSCWPWTWRQVVRKELNAVNNLEEDF